MDKVPAPARFLDFSDYTRPAARRLVHSLLPTRVSSIQVTWAFILVGTIAGLLFALSRWIPLAGLLVLLKSLLDGVDGSLARARARPSRVGRFLDSVGDFWVNLVLCLTIGLHASQVSEAAWPLALATVAFLSLNLQVSVYNHYYVLYRHAVGGDRTSLADEDETHGFPWDNPVTLRRLFTLYQWLYSWQDRWVSALDRWVAPGAGAPGPSFLTAVSVLGLGFQLLVIALCSFVGRPDLALWLLVTLLNLHAAVLFFVRGAAIRGFVGTAR